MNKTTYAILTLLFNSYGVTSFLNGNTKKGVFTIISAIVTFGIVGMINAIKGIIAGIKIFQMTDEAFDAADKTTLSDAIVFFYKD
ncbi:MAG: hypothetical protein J6V68_03980 [Clostridia bacterium]|nr:hypothetical protein [Clostridia bacterium]